MPGKYIAVLLFGSSSDDQGYKPLYEESYVEITASSEAEARKKALKLGRSRETTYENPDGNRITWRFMKMIDIAESLEDTNGDVRELYARHFYDLEAYRSMEILWKV